MERDKQVFEALDKIYQALFQNHTMEVIKMAGLVYEICQKARDVNLADKLDSDFMGQWVGFYDAPDIFMRHLFEFLSPDASPEDLNFIPIVFNPEQLEDCMKASLMGDHAIQTPEILEDLKNQLPVDDDDEVPDVLPDHFFEKCKTEPKMLFYFKVWFPCWVEYCEFLPALMQKTVKGDSGALEKLIRLDPCILTHPQVNIEYHKIRLNNIPLFDRLCKAQQGKGLRELTPTNVKYLFGAYIYRLLQTMDNRLRLLSDTSGFRFSKLGMSAEEILDLFNQRAQKTQGLLHDPDFESISAFKAGLCRYQSLWDNLLA